MADASGIKLNVALGAGTPKTVSPLPTSPEAGTGNAGCIYCLAKVGHPRLGRGESYACGYKPYRCEICNYSTVTKGNLAIHEQSDRHLNNVQEYDQQQKLNCNREVNEQGPPNSSIAHSVAHRILRSSPLTQSPVSTWVRSHSALNDPLNTNISNTNVNGVCSVSLLEVADHPLVCQVCGVFSTDSVEELVRHAEQNRIPLNLDCANQQVTSHSDGAWHCFLCVYRSPLKANFQLHCKTEKHAQRLSLLLHIWEGRAGVSPPLSTSPFLLSPPAKGSAYSQLRCLPCDFSTCSVHRMRVHCQMPAHILLVEAFSAIMRHRDQLTSLTTTSDCESMVPKAKVMYTCRTCGVTRASVMEIIHHLQSTNPCVSLWLLGPMDHPHLIMIKARKKEN
ncbi:unnamed protein product [Mesocestoides corti]|uniref:C2H2-type domain-containing protein n=2 Tax=Mesocestoides corti TaxID=53468 RepID=A0A0R3UFK0_MESCO|nr:unnamed protein product [Mesocestoides corti]